MATINLGNIKFNWKGTYAGGTAYVIDDVVSYLGSSYICKLASTGNLPTNTTYWDVMSQAGTDGTDIGTTLTTQGDLLYRDGSGLQRLAAGTSGQLLKTQGSGANPVWTTVDSGKIKQTHWQWDGSQVSIPSISSGSSTGYEMVSYNFTAQSANPHFALDLCMFIGRDNSGADNGDLYVIAYIEEGGTLRYPFGFYKSTGLRSNGTYAAQSGNYFLEDSDAGIYANDDNWSAVRYTYSGVMGNQQNADTTASASSNIAAGDTLTLKIKLGGSGNTWLNRTHSQTNSCSRSWWRLQELDNSL